MLPGCSQDLPNMRKRGHPADDRLSCGNVRILHVSAPGRPNNVYDAIDTNPNVDNGGFVLIIIRELLPMATLRGIPVRCDRVRGRPGGKPHLRHRALERQLSHVQLAPRGIVPALHGGYTRTPQVLCFLKTHVSLSSFKTGLTTSNGDASSSAMRSSAKKKCR